MKKIRILGLALVFGTVFSACEKSNDAFILEFSADDIEGNAIINIANNTITEQVPLGTELLLNTPRIVVSEGAYYKPNANIDFTQGPVEISVTSESGLNTTVYTVEVTYE